MPARPLSADDKVVEFTIAATSRPPRSGRTTSWSRGPIHLGVQGLPIRHESRTGTTGSPSRQSGTLVYKFMSLGIDGAFINAVYGLICSGRILNSKVQSVPDTYDMI